MVACRAQTFLVVRVLAAISVARGRERAAFPRASTARLAIDRPLVTYPRLARGREQAGRESIRTVLTLQIDPVAAAPISATTPTLVAGPVCPRLDPERALAVVELVDPVALRMIFCMICRDHSQAVVVTSREAADQELDLAKGGVANSIVPVMVNSLVADVQLDPAKEVAASNCALVATHGRQDPGKTAEANSFDQGIILDRRGPARMVEGNNSGRVTTHDHLVQARVVVVNNGAPVIALAGPVRDQAAIGGRKIIDPITDLTGMIGTTGGTIIGTIGITTGITIGQTTGMAATVGITAIGGTTVPAGAGTMAITSTGGAGPHGRQ